MVDIHRRRTRAQARSTRGQSLIEFAMLFPVVMVFLAAIVIFGLAMYARASLQQGVREGARQFAVGKSEAEVQSLTAGNAQDWIDANDVEICLPTGSNGNVGDSVRVQLRMNGTDSVTGVPYNLVPVGGIFSALGVSFPTVRLDPKGTARLEKSVAPGVISAC